MRPEAPPYLVRIIMKTPWFAFFFLPPRRLGPSDPPRFHHDPRRPWALPSAALGGGRSCKDHDENSIDFFIFLLIFLELGLSQPKLSKKYLARVFFHSLAELASNSIH